MANQKFKGHFSASGADYNPFENPTLSQWVRDCYNGDLPAVKAHVEKDPTLIEKRESILRMSGLFHVISGAKTIDPAIPIPREMKARLTSESGTCSLRPRYLPMW
jgi:hypothetical protein